MRNLEVLNGTRGSRLSKPGDRLQVPDTMARWIVHALLLTRSVERVGIDELTSAPELFMFDLTVNGGDQYPYVERINEGLDRSGSFVVRS